MWNWRTNATEMACPNLFVRHTHTHTRSEWNWELGSSKPTLNKVPVRAPHHITYYYFIKLSYLIPLTTHRTQRFVLMFHGRAGIVRLLMLILTGRPHTRMPKVKKIVFASFSKLSALQSGLAFYFYTQTCCRTYAKEWMRAKWWY